MQALTATFDTGGLKTSFLLGDRQSFPAHTSKDYMDYILQVWRSIKTGIGREWIGPFVCVVKVTKPDDVKLVLANADSKDNFAYNMLRPWLGNGLFTSEGIKWSTHRRLITPAFHFEILRPYVRIFVECTNIFLNKLTETNGESIDICHPVSLMTLDSLLKCSFADDSKCQIDESNEYTNAVFTMTKLFSTRYSFPPYHFAPIFHLSPLGFKWRKTLGILHRKTETIIRKRRIELSKLSALASAGEHRDGGREINKRKYMDFLDILLQARDEDGVGLTDLEIREEADTFMFGGHDTVSSAVSWCLYNLARFPEYQQQCRDEVENLLRDKDKDELDWDDLSSLPYITMFIKESLRFHTPAPDILRTLIKDVTLTDGTVLPKGTITTVSCLGMHHHPSYWEDPETFDPYRFLPERNKERHSHAYIPFSAGPRNCIGQNFAMNQIKVIVAMTTRRFVITVDADKPAPEWTCSIVLRSLNGIHLHFRQI